MTISVQMPVLLNRMINQLFLPLLMKPLQMLKIGCQKTLSFGVKLELVHGS